MTTPSGTITKSIQVTLLLQQQKLEYQVQKIQEGQERIEALSLATQEQFEHISSTQQQIETLSEATKEIQNQIQQQSSTTQALYIKMFVLTAIIGGIVIGGVLLYRHFPSSLPLTLNGS